MTQQSSPIQEVTKPNPVELGRQATQKTTTYLTGLNLKDGRDFRITTGVNGHCHLKVELNTGIDTKQYRRGIEESVKDMELKLHIQNSQVYVKPAKPETLTKKKR